MRMKGNDPGPGGLERLKDNHWFLICTLRGNSCAACATGIGLFCGHRKVLFSDGGNHYLSLKSG
jgi:hypothetical protein